MITCGGCARNYQDAPFRIFCECGTVTQTGITKPIKKRARVGAELKKIIPKLLKSKDCQCDLYARQMDMWGIDGCESRFDEIVAHLMSQAEKVTFAKHFPGINKAVATAWLRKAIDNAKASL